MQSPARVSPSQSITPRSSLSVVHSGDLTVHADGPECTAARVPTKQIPREQGTLNGAEPYKTLYRLFDRLQTLRWPRQSPNTVTAHIALSTVFFGNLLLFNSSTDNGEA